MEQLLDKISKAPPAAKYGGILVAIALLTAGNWYFFIGDLETKIESQRNQMTQLRSQLAEKQAIAQNLNELRREMDRLEQQLAEALTELPAQKDIDELLAQLNDVGKKSGLEISQIVPGNEASAGFYARIPVKMSVTGNFHEIGMFLQEVANMRRIINVNEIKLASPEVRNDKVVLKSEFLATTFRFLDQPQDQGQNQQKAKPGAKR